MNWLPADWHLIPGDPPLVRTPFDGTLPLDEALILLELKVTRSKSVDRDKKYACARNAHV